MSIKLIKKKKIEKNKKINKAVPNQQMYRSFNLNPFTIFFFLTLFNKYYNLILKYLARHIKAHYIWRIQNYFHNSNTDEVLQYLHISKVYPARPSL